jgi:predicted Rossmann fold nucleotide-binding protein DprA/Smf involved in DNA uptake
MLDDEQLAVVLLNSTLCAEGVAPLKAGELWALIGELGTVDLLLGLDAEEMVAELDFEPPQAARLAALMGRATAMAFELERLEQSGISTITLYDEDYPQRWMQRLGPKAPAVVHVAGAPSLLGTAGSNPCLGVVGSRDIDDATRATAAAAGAWAADHAMALVSGGAAGVDQTAMDAAAAAGGSVVGVMAEPLVRAVARPETRRAILAGTTALCTPYAPDAPFTAGRAHGRNRLVYALGDPTLVVSCAEGAGGTWTGATEAIAADWNPVAVWRGAGEGPGNGALADAGATAVHALDALIGR